MKFRCINLDIRNTLTFNIESISAKFSAVLDVSGSLNVPSHTRIIYTWTKVKDSPDFLKLSKAF